MKRGLLIGYWSVVICHLAVARVQSPRGEQTFFLQATRDARDLRHVKLPTNLVETPVAPELMAAPAFDPGELAITNISRAPGGTVTLRWSGGPGGMNYQVLAKTNPVQASWETILTTTNQVATVAAGGKAQVFKVRGDPMSPPSGSVRWLRAPVTSAAAQSRARAMAMDHAGNSIVAGSFTGTIDFAPSGGAPQPMVSVGGSDIFLAKYSASGALVWAKRFGGPLDDFANGVAVDSADNIVVTGDFAGAADFGGTILTAVVPVFGVAPDGFVAKYSPSGALSWAKRFGGSSGDSGSASAIDGSGNIFLAGTFSSGNADFGPFILSTAGNSDIALSKLSPAGTFLWARRYGGSDAETARCLALAGDSVWVGGDYRNATDLGGGLRGGFGNADLFVGKYASADGTYRLDKTLGTGGNDGAFGIGADAAGNVFVTGQYGGPVDFGCGSIGPGGIYLASLSSNGACRWSKSLNVQNFGFSTDGDSGQALTVDGAGNVVMAGQVRSTISFDGSNASHGNTVPAFFAASYSGAGVYRWAQRAVGTSLSVGQCASAEGAAGAFSGTFSLGGQSATGATFAVGPVVVRFEP